MNESNEEQILQELRRITRLLAMTLVKDEATQSNQIEILDRYGFQPKDIADLLRTTPNTVSVALSRIKKGDKGEKGKALKQAKVSKSDDE